METGRSSRDSRAVLLGLGMAVWEKRTVWMYFGYCITLYIDMVVKATTTWWEENYFLHTGLELGTCDCDVRRWQSGEFTKILLQTQGDR